jgi:hypothetical protein
MMKRVILFAVLAASIFSAPATAQEQAPVTREQLEEVKGALDGLSESFAEYRGYVDALRKIKISGYLQTQFRYTDLINTPFTVGNFSGGAFPANTKNLFQVRRGRLKFNYDNTLTQFVIQADFINTGFTLKDAYVTVTDPWYRTIGVQAGVFDRPFGYEISLSSSNRETPERSRLFQTLFPGERDLGAKIIVAPQTGPLSNLRLDIGLFNGVGPNANEVDNFKDLSGHLGYQIPFEEANAELDLGVSGYIGSVRSASKYIYAVADPGTGVKKFTVDSTASNLSSGVDRTYFGADAQLYLNVLPFGGTILRGEYVAGKQPGTLGSNASLTAAISGDVARRTFNGYYAYLVQNIGSRDQIMVKYDVLTPNTEVSVADFRTGTNLTSADIAFKTLGLGYIHYLDDNVKVVLYYELIANEKLDPSLLAASSSLYPYTSDVRDNVLTVRMQYKF